MEKDVYYVSRYGLKFFKKDKGLYYVFQHRGRGLANRYDLGVCIFVKHRYEWFFLPFSKKWQAAVGSTRVEAIRKSMGNWIETYDYNVAPEDTAE